MPVIILGQDRPKTECYLSEGNKQIETATAGSIKRTVLLEEVRDTCYADMADLAVIFNHEIVETHDETLRWRPNLFISWIHDHAAVYTPSAASESADGIRPYSRRASEVRASLNLTALVMDLNEGMFAMEEWMKFYMQTGYSLCGYAEIFGQKEAAEVGLPGAKKPKKDRSAYTENVIDYMIRVHKGKVLKL